MTQADTLKAIRALGMKARIVDGEYCINYVNGNEATAYYTDDADDAIATARTMSAEGRK